VKIVGRENDLLEIVLALGTTRSLTGLLHGGQQQCHQDPDDRNDHQQFDEGKTCPGHGASNSSVVPRLLPDNPHVETPERKNDEAQQKRTRMQTSWGQNANKSHKALQILFHTVQNLYASAGKSSRKFCVDLRF
jgi:hypothetical protein